MNVHLHHSRNVMGWVLGIAAFSPFVLMFESSSPSSTPSDVTGRVTYSGHPLNDAIICLDSEGGIHSAFGSLSGSDGTFRLLNFGWGITGAFRAGIMLTSTAHRDTRRSPRSIAIRRLPASRSRSTEIGATCTSNCTEAEFDHHRAAPTRPLAAMPRSDSWVAQGVSGAEKQNRLPTPDFARRRPVGAGRRRTALVCHAWPLQLIQTAHQLAAARKFSRFRRQSG